MAYRNYNFVIDPSFQPFSMQEMLAPLTLYKEAFEKSEEAYADLKTKADVFKDLSESLPENSKARQIYEGYANDLSSQAEDLARNGLNMGNRRALTSLKQRYSGEIGRLDRAKAALEEAKKMRSTLEASGKRRLYATNNFTIDDFLDGNTPNMYSVDPDVLYAKGAQRGKSVSSRMTDIKEGGSMVDGYFRNVIQSQGMNPQRLSQWMQSDEFSKMVDLAMLEEGVVGNLTGMDYLRAKQAYVSGIFDGVVYTEKNDLQRNPNVLDPKERHSIAMDNARFALQQQELADKREERNMELFMSGISRDANGRPIYNPNNDIEMQRKLAAIGATAEAKKNSSTGGSSSSGSSSGYRTQSKKRAVLTWESGDPNKDEKYRSFDNIVVEDVPDDEPTHVGKLKSFKDLPDWAKEAARVRIGDGNANMYEYYFEDYNDRWGPWNRHAKLEMVPRPIHKYGVIDDSVLDTDPDLEQ